MKLIAVIMAVRLGMLTYNPGDQGGTGCGSRHFFKKVRFLWFLGLQLNMNHTKITYQIIKDKYYETNH